MLDDKLIKILCCPSCKSEILYDEIRIILRCAKCKKDYSIKNNIPILLDL